MILKRFVFFFVKKLCCWYGCCRACPSFFPTSPSGLVGEGNTQNLVFFLLRVLGSVASSATAPPMGNYQQHIPPLFPSLSKNLPFPAPTLSKKGGESIIPICIVEIMFYLFVSCFFFFFGCTTTYIFTFFCIVPNFLLGGGE